MNRPEWVQNLTDRLGALKEKVGNDIHYFRTGFLRSRDNAADPDESVVDENESHSLWITQLENFLKNFARNYPTLFVGLTGAGGAVGALYANREHYDSRNREDVSIVLILVFEIVLMFHNRAQYTQDAEEKKDLTQKNNLLIRLMNNGGPAIAAAIGLISTNMLYAQSMGIDQSALLAAGGITLASAGVGAARAAARAMNTSFVEQSGVLPPGVEENENITDPVVEMGPPEVTLFSPDDNPAMS